MNQSTQELMYQKQITETGITGRQGLAGRIVKRKDVSTMSIHDTQSNINQSQISQIQRPKDLKLDEDEDIKQFPLGELLLRHDELLSNRFSDNPPPIQQSSNIDVLKRVDLMMEREKEKQQWLDVQR